MAVLIQNIESIEIHRQKRNKIKRLRKKTTKKTTTGRLVNGARWAFQCFVYNTNTITDPFIVYKDYFQTLPFFKVKMPGFEQLIKTNIFSSSILKKRTRKQIVKFIT